MDYYLHRGYQQGPSIWTWWRHCRSNFPHFLPIATKLVTIILLIVILCNFQDIRSHMSAQHLRVLFKNPDLILIEPFLLERSLVYDGLVQDGELKEFRWRFNLTEDLFRWDNQSLTVAIFVDRFERIQLNLGSFVESHRVCGPAGPFDNPSNNHSVLHVFYEWNKPPTVLQLHLVVLYLIDNYLWVGAIPNGTTLFAHVLHFGLYEQIYDPFEGSSVDGITLPDDVSHFLSQLSTDRYLHCPPERTAHWLEANKLSISQGKTVASENAIVGMKGLMREMQMQFWLASGTLLGWYRLCHITPYTDDTDFATWLKYASMTPDLTETLLVKAEDHNLILRDRFGEPSRTLEYSFHSTPIFEKVDLFTVYPNGTHYLLPYHFIPHYSYSIYPQYELCSVALLGYKMIAPCTPEEVIRTEYGPNWNLPIRVWNYSVSPHNYGPSMKYDFDGSQHEFFNYEYEYEED